MKQVTITANVSLTAELFEILKKCNVMEYSVIPRSHGVGLKSGPRMDSHVWPGFNITVLAVLEDASALAFMDALQEFRDGPVGGRTGVYAWMTSVDRVLK